MLTGDDAIYGLTVPATNACMGLLKDVLEAGPLPPDSKWHVPVLNVLTVVVNLAAVLLVFFFKTATVDKTGLGSALGAGLLLGFGSIGVYKLAVGGSLAANKAAANLRQMTAGAALLRASPKEANVLVTADTSQAEAALDSLTAKIGVVQKAMADLPPIVPNSVVSYAPDATPIPPQPAQAEPAVTP